MNDPLGVIELVHEELFLLLPGHALHPVLVLLIDPAHLGVVLLLEVMSDHLANVVRGERARTERVRFVRGVSRQQLLLLPATLYAR